MKKLIVIFLLTIFAAFLSSCGTMSSAKKAPVARQGRIDLSNWDFKIDGPTNLDGEWEFYWHQLVQPSSLATGPIPKPDGFIKVPDYWNRFKVPNSSATEEIGGFGYGSYLLRVKLGSSGQPFASHIRLALSMKFAASSYRLYVLQNASDESPSPFMENGITATTKQETVPQALPLVRELNIKTDEIIILIQVSNYHYFNGGLAYRLKIGTPFQLTNIENARIYRASLLLGVLLIMALYHLGLFSQRRNDKASLVFALICLLITYYFAHIEKIPDIFFTDPNKALWVLRFKILLVCSYFTLALFLVFFHLVFPSYYKESVRNFVILLVAVVSLFSISVPVEVIVRLNIFLNIVGGGILFYLLVPLLIASVKNVEGARIALIGSVFLMATGVNDILHATAIIHTQFLLPYGMVLFILAQSAILSQRFASAHLRAEKLTFELNQEVEHQTHELLEKNEKLEELDKQKTRFFQNISHELRTPLTLILNPLEQAQTRYKNDRDLEIAGRNARRLLRLVNQLLEFQKISAGEKKLIIKTVDLVKFLQVSGDMFQSACQTKQIGFDITMNGRALTDDRATVIIRGDTDALEKIVFNYLSNALKFTPKAGKITLDLTVGQQMAKISVIDSGKGIAKEDLDKLFRIFSQLDDQTTREHEGSGLGLALVKELAEAMHGTVGVDMSHENGAAFFVEFPTVMDAPKQSSQLETFQPKQWHLADVERLPLQTSSEEKGEAEVSDDRQRELLLIVDDLPDMRELISRTLRKHDYRIVTAENGKDAFDAAKQVKPDLIITDWMMPVLSGPKFIEKLKGDADLSSIPVILLTAKSDEESKLIGVEIGADSFLGKPFNEQELVSIVRNLLLLKVKQKEVEKLNRHITENVLKRYLPPDLIDKILSGKMKLDGQGRSLPVTVLFSDLCNFTRTTSELGARKISWILNDYLDNMIQVIFDCGGTIDKFIGDAIMVIFGAPSKISADYQIKQATRCAAEMQKALTKLSDNWRSLGIAPIRMRIGIHHGAAIVGDFGNDRRSDYTAIGPTVNLAARIETVCEPGQIFISQVVFNHLPESLADPVGFFELKGIEEKIPLFLVKQF